MTCPNILLAITGGISAYKSAVLARLLIKAGCTVRVMMTDGACEFITPLTLQALTGNEVHTKLLDDEAERGMGHIELAKWADMVVIAPASANTIGRLAGGQPCNHRCTCYNSSHCHRPCHESGDVCSCHRTG